ncbi:hypothetical protein PAPYR_5896 [Paratrimastix pyriformis]|uniref:Homeobox domain-containing protein n=1 Tax=Paratrimastix pyriformis TaxID=342808 RepID=A0ABQ8UGG5_9EUKA|nr:hypothetical protein PAPYR_5896 [Paratrimastix pyriformis]
MQTFVDQWCQFVNGGSPRPFYLHLMLEMSAMIQQIARGEALIDAFPEKSIGWRSEQVVECSVKSTKRFMDHIWNPAMTHKQASISMQVGLSSSRRVGRWFQKKRWYAGSGGTSERLVKPTVDYFAEIWNFRNSIS